MSIDRNSPFYKARTQYNVNGFESLSDVQRETGIGHATINALEQKEGREVSHKKIKTLAEHYGVTADYLLGLDELPTRDGNLINAMVTTGFSLESLKVLQFINNHADRENDGSAQINLEIIRFIDRVLSGLSSLINEDEYGSPEPLYCVFNLMEQYVNSGKAVFSDYVASTNQNLSNYLEAKKMADSGGEPLVVVDYGSIRQGFSASEISRNVLMDQIRSSLEALYQKEVSNNGKA